jgi:putative ABC transport system permease protein
VWQFSKPVFIANLVAWPLAFYFMSQWLSGFAFRIDMHLIYFIGPSLLAVLVAWVTVAGHAYRVARTNPVHALRHE